VRRRPSSAFRQQKSLLPLVNTFRGWRHSVSGPIATLPARLGSGALELVSNFACLLGLLLSLPSLRSAAPCCCAMLRRRRDCACTRLGGGFRLGASAERGRAGAAARRGGERVQLISAIFWVSVPVGKARTGTGPRVGCSWFGLLQSFTCRQSEDGHRRYVAVRNLRGE
jgi:hypothetical protein